MDEQFLFKLHHNLAAKDSKRSIFIRQAFQMLPPFQHPQILDIGCGSGVSTIELAKVSSGTIIGLDTDQIALAELSQKIEMHHLKDRIRLVHQSMTEMDFPSESFDIIWSEASIYAIGFQRGLREWKDFLKKKGFFVIHEMCWIQKNPPRELKRYWEKRYPGITTIDNNIKRCEDAGYRMCGYFSLPDTLWWKEYYYPLQKRIARVKEHYENDSETLAILHAEQKEIDLYKKYRRWFGSAYFVIQR